MDWLNYNHLQYFWNVVRLGGVTPASRELLISASTISEQIRQLETALGVKLLKRVGRNVQPTPRGELVYRYADEIFSLGRELQGVVRGEQAPREKRLRVTALMSIPKLMVRQVIEPVLKQHPETHLTCREGTHDELLTELTSHQAEIAITDRPLASLGERRLFHHPLGSAQICLMATGDKSARWKRNFPQGLDGAPLLLPTQGTALRAVLDEWLVTVGVNPRVVGEFDDSALMKEFAATGAGVVALPSVVEHAARKQFGLRRVALLEEVTIAYFAVTLQRHITDPLLEDLVASAKQQLA